MVGSNLHIYGMCDRGQNFDYGECTKFYRCPFILFSKRIEMSYIWILKVTCVWHKITRIHPFIELIKQCPYKNMISTVQHNLSLWISLPNHFMTSFEIVIAMCTNRVVVWSWIQISLTFRVTDNKMYISYLISEHKLCATLSGHHVYVCKKTECTVKCSLPLRKIFVYSYTMIGNMCIVVVKRMSSDTNFLIKQSIITILINTYCLHHDCMAISRGGVWRKTRCHW
jgi:hypothetical protein